MYRFLFALGLLSALAARPAAAQSADAGRPAAPDDEGEAALRARFADLGIPFPERAPRAATPAAPLDDEDPEALLARRLAERGPVGNAPPGDAFSVSGDILVRGLNTTVRVRAVSNVGELNTYQGLDVNATSRVDPTTGWLVFRGDRASQAFRSGAPLTLGRVRINKTAGRVVLNPAGVGGTGTYSFGTLDLTDDVLATPTSLPITTALSGTGGLAFTGTSPQTLTLPSAGLTVPSVYLEQTGTTLTFAQATNIGTTLRNSGTSTLFGPVTVGLTATLDLASGTLMLGNDLDVFGVVNAGGGTFARGGFTLRLAPTTAGSTVNSLAAVAGDGSAIGVTGADVAHYERPYLDGQGWRMIASPFAAQPFATLTDDFHTQGGPGADVPFGDPNLIRWVPSNAPGARYVGVTDFNGLFESGRGYFLYAFATDPNGGAPILPTTWDVDGVEPSGSVIIPLSYDPSDAEKRFNLLGNPYASPIDWHAVQTAGSFQASYGVWDPAANGGLGNYAYYSSAGSSTGRAGRYIPAFQGFWTESSISSPFGITYQRAWKAPAGAPVYAGRTGEAAVAELRLHLEGAGLEATEPVALFLDGGDDGPDVYDGAWLRPLSADYAAAFFVRDDARLVFDARPADPAAATLAVAVQTTRGGTYSLTWPDLDRAPGGPLTLLDHVTGARVDMRAAARYAFTLPADAAPGTPGALPSLTGVATAARFAVVFGAVTGTEGEAGVPPSLALEARPNPVVGRAVVRFGLPWSCGVRASVYDALGREVAVLAAGERSAGWHEAVWDASVLSSGVYVVRLEAGGAVLSRRVTVAR